MNHSVPAVPANERMVFCIQVTKSTRPSKSLTVSGIWYSVCHMKYNQRYDDILTKANLLKFGVSERDIDMPAVRNRTGIRMKPKILSKIQLESAAKPRGVR